MAETNDTQTPFPAIPRAYVNYAGGQGSLLEAAVSLGYKEGEADPLPVAHIVMSWEFMPVLIKLLQDQLDAYQENVGPVRNILQVPEGETQ